MTLRFHRLVLLTLAGLTLAGCGGAEMSEQERAGAITRTQGELRSLATAIESFSLDDDEGHYPQATGIDELAALLEPTYLSEVPREDAWGRPYDYTTSGTTYVLISLGPDGKVATPDDLKITTGRERF